MIVLLAPGLPGTAKLLAFVGLLLVAASLVSPLARWRAAATLAAAAAIAESAFGHHSIAVLAAEGLLILGYLLLVDSPAAVRPPTAVRWLWLQLPAAAWGAVASGVVLAALALAVPVSAWLLVAGASAAVAAAILALPRRARRPARPRRRR
jgi:hypothetical protein